MEQEIKNRNKNKKTETLLSTNWYLKDLSAREWATKDVAQVEELKERREKKRRECFLCTNDCRASPSSSFHFILSGLSLPFTHRLFFNWKSLQ